MKRIVTAIFAAILLFSSCTTVQQEPEDTSYITADTIEEAGFLTAVYRVDFSTTIPGGAIPSPITSTDSGYRYAESENNVGLHIRTGEESVTASIPDLRRESLVMIQDGYLYLASNTRENTYTLFRVTFDGEITAEIPAESLKPEGNAANYPGDSDWYTNVNELPIAEIPDGYAIVWGDTVVYTDREFAVTSTEKLPSTVYHIRYDTVTGELWAHYKAEDAWMLRNLTTDTDYTLPARFERYMNRNDVKVTAVHDGYAYGFDAYAAFRWKISAGSEAAEPEEVFNYTNSSVNGQYFSEVWPVFTEDGVCFTAKYLLETSFEWMILHCIPMPDIDLSKVVTLELAHAIGYQVNEAVAAFNQNNKDVRILVNDYTRFASSDGMTPENRLRTDLETGILKPDLVVTQDTVYRDMAENMKGYFVDLHTIQSGSITTDDIWNSVVTGLEIDGKLYGMASSITTISGLVALDEKIPLDHWNLEEIMDYMEAIPQGEYMIQIENGSEFSTGSIFGYHIYDEFIATDGFLSPLYLRYLNFAKNLKTNARRTPDSASYPQGTIHVMDVNLTGMTSILSMMRAFAVTDAGALNFIGHPAVTSDGEFEGFELTFLRGITSVTKHCEHPDAAWKYIEQAMTTEADKMKTSTEFLYGLQGIPVLRDPVLEHLRAFEGVDFFYEYGTGSPMYRCDSLTEEYLLKTQGIRFTVTESHTEAWANLLDKAELSWVNRKHQPMRSIINQEEKAFFNGTSTAENTQTSLNRRINLCLAEHGK
ncbi:MAG: hypothetical protein IJ037_09515 [Clostridia bacterium]|nr:hypothetical protein [Clostridia bacterium]